MSAEQIAREVPAEDYRGEDSAARGGSTQP